MVGFDTLHLWLSGNHLQTSQHFMNPTEHLQNEKYSVSGSLGNLRVSCSESGLSLKGSFAKVLNGNNIQTLNPRELSIVTENLSDLFSVDLKPARINRVDLGTTLEMDYPPTAYYSFLGSLARSNRQTHSSSLSYINSQRKWCFYDKVVECISSGTSIPNELVNANLFRAELSYLNNVSRQLKCTGLTVQDLTDETLYETLKQGFVKGYHQIKKINETNQFSYDYMKGKKQLHQQAILLYIENRGGLLNVLNEVEQAQKMGQLTKKQAFDLRAEYNSVGKSKVHTNESKLISELTSKIGMVL